MSTGTKVALAIVLTMIAILAIGIGVHLLQLNEIKNNLKVEGVELSNVKVTDSIAGIPTKVELDLKLKVHNPTSYTLDIERLTYAIYIEGRLFGRGSLRDLVIPAYSTYSIPIVLEISTVDMVSTVIDYIRSGGFNVKVSGVIDIPIKFFGLIKLFTVSAPYAIERYVTASGAYIPTVLTLNKPPSIVSEGQVVVFTGRLVRRDNGEPIGGAAIKIYDSDVEFDDLMAEGYTDPNGYFSIRWVAEPKDPFDRTVEVYAKFEGSGLYGPSSSERFIITVSERSKVPTTLTLSPPPSSIVEGQPIIFSGRLVIADTGEPVAGAVIKIYDSDVESDDLVASGMTDSDGYFYITWTAEPKDPFDRTVEVYAKFEGTDRLEASRAPKTYYVINIQPRSSVKTVLILDEPPSVVAEGSTVIFTGRLLEANTGNPIPNAVIKIYDSDYDRDDLMASGITNSQGFFTIAWTAKPMDPFDNTVEVYAKFEGSDVYRASQSAMYTITVHKYTIITGS